jgi:hypothetical protein
MFSLCAYTLLGACATVAKKPNIMDLYELPTAAQPSSGDNDSYYVQPSSYKGCAVINDAPSCGGG